MDSRQLYMAADHLRGTLNWEKDWFHFGTGEKIKFELIKELVVSFLDSKQLNLVCERTTSGTIENDEVMTKIKELLGTKDFQLWNQSMNRSIQFKSMGVLLKGQKNDPTTDAKNP